MEKAIAYNVENNEVVAVIEAATRQDLEALVEAQNYDYEEVNVSYGADFGLVYTDATETIRA